MSVRIFESEKHANIYSKFRPTVPQNVIEVALKYLESKMPAKDWQTAVDVGCGSGQGTNKLAKYFKKCYGFDVSPAQIREAKETKHCDNVFYDVSPAESLTSIKTNSVQFLTAFEAAHWFDFNQFFKESDRILVENGVVALIGYMIAEPIDPEAPEDRRLIDLLRNAYFDQRLAPYKNPKIEPTESHYRDYRFPENYEFVHVDNIADSFQDVAQNLIGFVESLSLYQGLCIYNPGLAQKFIQEFEQNLKTILKTNDLSKKELTLKFNYFIAMGRKRSTKH